MKLIYIVNARIPTEKAHGIQIMKMCEAFVDANNANQDTNIANKIDVELVVPQRRNNIIKDPFEYYGIEKKFKITKLPCLDLIPLGLGAFGFYVQQFSFSFAAAAYSLFKKNVVFYSRDILPCFFLGLLGKGFFLELHRLSKKEKLFYSFVFKRAKGIISTNNFKAEYIKNNYKISGKKILVYPNGFDQSLFDITLDKNSLREQLSLFNNKPIIMYTGHLYGWKGAHVLAQAAKLITEANFYFIGGTDSDIADFKKKYSGENLFFLGRKPFYEIPKYQKAADVLVLPNSAESEESRNDTSPIKLFEYMASGRPIVASDLPSIREILNNANSLLVEPDDPEELSDGIKKILEDKGPPERIANQALIDSREYTWKNRARKIIDFINYCDNFTNIIKL
jgi:glycosyltransferase involved in cell wall biosynthesis